MQRNQQSLIDISDSIFLIFEYIRETNWTQFSGDLKARDAVIRRLTIIGEATKRLSNEFRDSHPEIPWKQMAGLRDVIVHDYDEIDLDVLREIVDVNLPEVLQNLQPLLPLPPENHE
jgi:uncharacterized protein with HEPN domain